MCFWLVWKKACCRTRGPCSLPPSSRRRCASLMWASPGRSGTCIYPTPASARLTGKSSGPFLRASSKRFLKNYCGEYHEVLAQRRFSFFGIGRRLCDPGVVHSAGPRRENHHSHKPGAKLSNCDTSFDRRRSAAGAETGAVPAALTVGDFLRENQIGLAATDQISPPLWSFVGEGMEIVIDRIVDLEVMETKSVPFAVVRQNDA